MKIFIHGLESSGKGFKGRFFKEIFPEILTPDFRGELFERMSELKKILKDSSDITIIGSSFGGLMGTLYTLENPLKVKKLILLAPAISFKKELFKNKQIIVETIIYHGKHDNIVPIEPVKKLAEVLFANLIFNETDDDHMLHKTVKKIDWKSLI